MACCPGSAQAVERSPACGALCRHHIGPAQIVQSGRVVDHRRPRGNADDGSDSGLGTYRTEMTMSLASSNLLFDNHWQPSSVHLFAAFFQSSGVQSGENGGGRRCRPDLHQYCGGGSQRRRHRVSQPLNAAFGQRSKKESGIVLPCTMPITTIS